MPSLLSELRGVNLAGVAPLYFREKGGRVLVTNDWGGYALLKGRDFVNLLKGSLRKGSRLWDELQGKGFIRDHMDFKGLSRSYIRRTCSVDKGPSLHIFVVTLRCNHKCVYCHSTRLPGSGAAADMGLETARAAVDFAFRAPGPDLVLEFQGGEPLLNWPVVRFAVLYAGRRNELAGKNLLLSIVTNLSLMNEEKLDFLIAHGVSVCTSLDGPEEIHNRNRVFLGGNSHALTKLWLARAAAKVEALRDGRIDFIPGALMTTTRFSLPYHRQIVDEYVGQGLKDIFLRPLSPIGLPAEVWEKIGYGPDEFVGFYASALDYILKLNLSGKRFVERTAFMLLSKIVGGRDPAFLDLRSPCGAAIGQLAYNFDGDIYTCDEGRMVARRGDKTFKVGNVFENRFGDIVKSPAARMCVLSSLLESQPSCARCAFKPFCGVCPVHNYDTQGGPWGRMAESDLCAVQKGIFECLFERLDDPRRGAVLRSWLKKTTFPQMSPTYS